MKKMRKQQKQRNMELKVRVFSAIAIICLSIIMAFSINVINSQERINNSYKVEAKR